MISNAYLKNKLAKMFDEILDISILYTFLEIVLHLMASVKAQMTHSGAHFNDQIIYFFNKKNYSHETGKFVCFMLCC